MLKFTLKTMMAMSAVAAVSACGGAIEDLIEDEIGDRVNDAAGPRLFLLHGNTTLNGEVRTASVSTDGSGNVTQGALGAAEDGSVTTRVTFGNNDSVEYTRGDGTTVFNEDRGADTEYDRARGLTIVSTSSNGRERGFLGNEHILDFDHQTYGMWVTGIGTTNGSVSVGSFGHTTAASDVPTSGSATYRGNSIGYAVGTDQRAYMAESEIAITTSDFNTVSMSSTNTTIRPISGGAMSVANQLNFNGTGTISGTGFTANIAGTAPISSTTTGTAEGTFYGDGADEVGGTFSMSGPIGTYIGAFGAEQ
ncbi:transferrin-binding protein-like solute binding protein [Shimia sp.]|uniref:transferrin-binding protein-like solute binding protein n=1 Tax=Shimia sp. TaxID=1954381 RepID=UPI003B8CEFA0